jgi:hypothetical protein
VTAATRRNVSYPKWWDNLLSHTPILCPQRQEVNFSFWTQLNFSVRDFISPAEEAGRVPRTLFEGAGMDLHLARKHILEDNQRNLSIYLRFMEWKYFPSGLVTMALVSKGMMLRVLSHAFTPPPLFFPTKIGGYYLLGNWK